MVSKIIKDTIWINSDSETVFNALTVENELLNWFPDLEAKITLENGGDILFKWRDGAILKSKLLSVTLNQELSYGFYGGPSEPVSFKLTSEKNGTRLDLLHTIPDGNNVDMLIDIASNWAHLLVGLKCWIEKKWDIR